MHSVFIPFIWSITTHETTPPPNYNGSHTSTCCYIRGLYLNVFEYNKAITSVTQPQPNLNITARSISFAAQLSHCCCMIDWMGIRVIVSTPPWQCSPAVLRYWGSNCRVSLCFTLCAQPYITPAFAHCAISQPQELCIKLCNSNLRSLCNFMLSSARFKTGHSQSV